MTDDSSPVVPPPRKSNWEKPSHWIGAGVILVLFAGCAIALGSSDDSGGGGGSSNPSKYTQTWPKSYAATNCSEWNSSMSSSQQFAAAADMLTGARNRGDGGVGLPPDSLIDDFRQGVTTACVIDTMSLADVGAGLYLTDRDRFRP